MYLRMIAPLLASSSSLSMLRRGRDLVCYTNGLFKILDTVALINSLPLWE